MKESELLKSIQVSFTNLGARLFRNNTGNGWVGKASRKYQKYMMVKVGPGDVLIRNARPIKFGLCVGSSDLIGWTSLTVTQDLVGHKLAIFTAIEGKTGKSVATEEQEKFIEAIKQAGGYAGVARDGSSAVEIINGWPGRVDE